MRQNEQETLLFTGATARCFHAFFLRDKPETVCAKTPALGVLCAFVAVNGVNSNQEIPWHCISRDFAVE